MEGRGLLPRRASTRGGPPGEVSDDEVRAIVAATRPRMQALGARTATRPASSRSTAGPACRARAAGRRSGCAVRATTTGRPSGARRVRRDRRAASATRAPTTSPRATRSRRSTRRSPRRVDMIEFDVLPEDPDDPAGSRLLLAHDYAHLGPRRAHARGGPRPPRRRTRSPASSSTSTSSSPATRRACSTRCARTASWSGRSSPRCSCAASSTLRELEPALRLGWSVPRVKRDYTRSWAHQGARLRAALQRAPAAAARRRRARPRRALRRAHGPPPARHAAARRGAAARRAATSTCGRSTTPRRSAAWTRSASPASSRTTRACSAARGGARRSRRCAAEKSAGSAPAVPGWPAVVTPALALDRPGRSRFHVKSTTPRSWYAPPDAGRLELERPARVVLAALGASRRAAGPESAPLRMKRQRPSSRYWTRKRIVMRDLRLRPGIDPRMPIWLGCSQRVAHVHGRPRAGGLAGPGLPGGGRGERGEE